MNHARTIALQAASSLSSTTTGRALRSASSRRFAPFYRRKPARDPAKAGVGLGLSIARAVAREHGGDVTLRDRDGGGLSAQIELPA